MQFLCCQEHLLPQVQICLEFFHVYELLHNPEMCVCAVPALMGFVIAIIVETI